MDCTGIPMGITNQWEPPSRSPRKAEPSTQLHLGQAGPGGWCCLLLRTFTLICKGAYSGMSNMFAFMCGTGCLDHLMLPQLLPWTSGMLRCGTRPWILWAQTLHPFPFLPRQVKSVFPGPPVRAICSSWHQHRSLFPQSSQHSSRQWACSPALHGKDKVAKNIWKGAWCMKALTCPWNFCWPFPFSQAWLFLPWFNRFLNSLITFRKYITNNPKYRLFWSLLFLLE